MPVWVTIVNQVGFPIFVAVVLLWRVDTMHAENLKAIAALTEAVTALRLTIQPRNYDVGGKP